MICALVLIQIVTMGPAKPQSRNVLHVGVGQTYTTIQACANAARDGDTCLVHPGTYTGSVTVSADGNASRVITFKSSVDHAATIQNVVTLSGDYLVWDGFVVEPPSSSTRGIDVTGSYNRVTNNRVVPVVSNLGLNNTGIRLAAATTGNSVSRSYVSNVCFGMTISGDTHLVYDNEINDVGVNGTCGDVDYSRFDGAGHIFRGNYFHGADLVALDGLAHVDCYQTFDNGGTSSFNILIERNFCRDAHQGVLVSADALNLSDGLIIRSNVFTNVPAFCVSASNYANVQVFNNTCDVHGGQYGFLCRGTGGTGSCEFKNNIIYGAGTLFAYGCSEAAMCIDGSAGAPGKNNLLYDPDSTITGYAADVKNVDPLFTNVAGADYTLQVGSPAIGAALTIMTWSPSLDKNGTARPQGAAWDIGAYERVQ